MVQWKMMQDYKGNDCLGVTHFLLNHDGWRRRPCQTSAWVYTIHSMPISDGCFFADRSLAPTWERLWMRATRQEVWIFGRQPRYPLWWPLPLWSEAPQWHLIMTAYIAISCFPWRPRASVSWHFVSPLAFLWGRSWVESGLAGKLGVCKGWQKVGRIVFNSFLFCLR